MTTTAEKRSLLIFDCDPGCDEALAITLIAKNKRYKEIDLLTVAGNVSVEQTTANAHRIIALLKQDCVDCDMKVYRGCTRSLMGDLPLAASVHGRDGLGDVPNNNFFDPPVGGAVVNPCEHEDAVVSKPENAVVRLIQLATIDDVTAFDLLCTGPLTNLATALNLMDQTQRLKFWDRCKRFVVMGGIFGCQGNITHSAEFNIFFDPLAAQMVLDFLSELEPQRDIVPDKRGTAELSKIIPPNKIIPTIYFVPLDATETIGIPLGKQNEKKLDAQGEKTRLVTKFLFYALQQYGEFHSFHCKHPEYKNTRFPIERFDSKAYLKSQLGGSLGISELSKFCYLHDPLAAWILLNFDENSSYWQKAWIKIDTSRGDSRGRIIHCRSKLKSEDGPMSQLTTGTAVKWLDFNKNKEEAKSKEETIEIRANLVEAVGDMLCIETKADRRD